MPAQNIIEILIKANSTAATKELSKVDKELGKLGKNFDSYMSGLKSGIAGNKEFGNMLLESGKNAGLSNSQMIRLTQSSGLFSKAQLNAAETMYKAQTRADELALAVSKGSISSREAARAFGEYTKSLETNRDKLMSFVGGFTKFLAIAGVSVGVLYKIGQGVKNLADNYMDYAFQVKDFGRIIGATPEEASKLIQAADDARLSVESMTAALRGAIIKGYEPNIEGLGKLSDEYLAIQDPIARSKFLIDTFGRAGLEMAKLMELGSARIKEMGDSIEGTGRLMTEEGIAKAQAYYDALDRIGDAAEDAKLSLASALFPAVVSVADETANLSESALEWIPVMSTMQKGMEAGAITMWDVQAALIAYITNGKDLSEIQSEITAKTNAVTDATENSAAQLLIEGRALQVVKETSESAGNQLGNLVDPTIQSGDAAWKASDAYKSMASGIAAAAASAARLKGIELSFDFSVPDIEDDLVRRMKSIDWARVGGATLEKLFVDITPRLGKLDESEYDSFARQFSGLTLAAKVEIGEISKYEAAEELRKAFGGTYAEAKATIKAAIEVDAASEENVRAYLSGQSFSAKLFPELDDAALKTAQDEMGTEVETAIIPKLNQAILAEQLSKIPASKTLTINVKLAGVDIGALESATGKDINGNGIIGKATGGPVIAGKPYWVGERGVEMFIPNMSGRIIPNSQVSNITNQPTTITNTFILPQQTNVRELARLVYKEQQRAGVT